MENPLTPNTAAFFDYITRPTPTDENNANPTSLPPSALFSMPASSRDTPEDTPPSATEQNSNDQDVVLSDSDSLELPSNGTDRVKQTGGSGAHKRKAGQSRPFGRDIEDESGSDFPSGHEDKRHSTHKPVGTGGRIRELSKAEKRKEQNRAAQKAFRERREARVKNLEDQVQELESKAYGAQIENENLRGILKRLQEENVALKQSAFTFSMPVNSRTNPIPAGNSHLQDRKPPTPPGSGADEFKGVKDSRLFPHRNSSSTFNDASPESLVSLSTTDQTPPSLFPDDLNSNPFGPVSARPTGNQPTQNLFQNDRPSMQTFSSNSSSSTNFSPPETDQSEINALWNSLYPNGIEALFDQTQGAKPGKPFQLLSEQPDSMSFGKADADINSLFNFDIKPADSIPSTNDNPPSVPAPAMSSDKRITQNLGVQDKAADWNRFAFRSPDTAPSWDIIGNSVDEFLASLIGNDSTIDNDVANEKGAEGRNNVFAAQLHNMFGTAVATGISHSPAASFNMNDFSPGKYLNIPPSPVTSLVNSQSPQSSASASGSQSNTNVSGGKSMSNSPECLNDIGTSSNTSISTQSEIAHFRGGSLLPEEARKSNETGDGLSSSGLPKVANEIVHIVDEKGRIVKPSELWMKFGMPYESSADHLMIDDLCEQMRRKATCKGGVIKIAVDDAKHIIRKGDPADCSAEKTEKQDKDIIAAAGT
ncbi:hypothetical protein L204_103915 [Cryptococcus depauperatus]